jgi:hypothetical protein
MKKKRKILLAKDFTVRIEEIASSAKEFVSANAS